MFHFRKEVYICQQSVTYFIQQIEYQIFHYDNSANNMKIAMILVILAMVVYKVQTFISATSLFNKSALGVGSVISHSILINSSQNLIVSLNQNGVQYINKYSVQSGQLSLQLQTPVGNFNPNLDAVTLLRTVTNQTQLIAFCGTSQLICVLDINTLTLILSATTFLVFAQLIWSPANNNVYYVDNSGNFGYLSATAAGSYSTNFLYTFSPTTLHMSVSLNYTYILISSTADQFFIIFNIKTNSFIRSVAITGTNTTGHEWFSDQIVYVMPYSSGLLYSYNVTSNSLMSFNCASALTGYVHSFHINTLSNGSFQYIIGQISVQPPPNSPLYFFSQFDLATLTVVNSYKITMTENLAKLQYGSNSPQNAILIFSTYIDSIRFIQSCSVGYFYDPLLFVCSLTTIVNSTTTTTNSANSSLNYTSLSAQQLQTFDSIVKTTVSNQAITTFNKVPGNRRLLQPVFKFFANFDDLQLYIYHQRNYDYIFTSFLQTIQNLQNQKWNTIKFEAVWSQMGLNTTAIKQNLDLKYDYTSWKFIEVEGNSSGFMINTVNLFLSNVFLIFLMFLVLRIVFFVLFKYTISKIVREYSFWPYLYFMLIDGNLQFLAYMFTCQVQHFFSFNFSNKLGMVFMVVIFFIIFILINCSYFILRQMYGVLAKYFFDDTKVSVDAAIYLTLQFGYRNLLLGVVHALFNQLYVVKLSLLLTIQIVFLINSLFFFKKKRFFSNSTRVLINIVASLLRVALILAFFFNQDNQIASDGMTTLQVIMEEAHLIIVEIYLLLSFFSIGFQLCKIGYELIQFIRKKNAKNEQQQVQRLKIVKKQRIFQKDQENGVVFVISEQKNNQIQNQCRLKIKRQIQNRGRILKNVKKSPLTIKYERQQVESVIQSLHDARKRNLNQ